MLQEYYKNYSEGSSRNPFKKHSRYLKIFQEFYQQPAQDLFQGLPQECFLKLFHKFSFGLPQKFFQKKTSTRILRRIPQGHNSKDFSTSRDYVNYSSRNCAKNSYNAFFNNTFKDSPQEFVQGLL